MTTIRLQTLVNTLRRALLAAALGTVAMAAQAQDNRVVLINVFEVPVGAETATLQQWEQARDFLKRQPGYVNTRLHQNLDANGRFRFVNVAEWESPQAFRNASEAMGRELKPVWPEGVKYTPSLFRVVAQ